MSDICAEGTLYIDLVDLWQWIESHGIDIEAAQGVHFNPEAGELVVKSTQDRYIDGADFWTWVIEHHLPEGLRAFESIFGVPRMASGELRIGFAVSSVSDPAQWQPKPQCLRSE